MWRGVRWRDSRKHRLGSRLTSKKPKGIPQRAAEALGPARAKRGSRLVVSRSATPHPAPRGRWELSEPLVFFEK